MRAGIDVLDCLDIDGHVIGNCGKSDLRIVEARDDFMHLVLKADGCIVERVQYEPYDLRRVPRLIGNIVDALSIDELSVHMHSNVQRYRICVLTHDVFPSDR